MDVEGCVSLYENAIFEAFIFFIIG